MDSRDPKVIGDETVPSTRKMLNVGDKVPDLSAPLHAGGEFSSAKLRGTPYVIYFYPKDFTPG